MSEQREASGGMVLCIVLLTPVYVALARLGLAMDAVGGFATLVWAPSGLALAALLMFGRRVWPAVALGAFVANLLAGAPLAVAAAIGAGNAVEALVAARLLGRTGYRLELDRPRDVLALVALAAPVGAAVAATIGTLSLLAFHVVPASIAWATWWAWWLGDVAGILIVTPVLTVGRRSVRALPRLRPKRALEALGVLAATVAVGAVVFFGSGPAPLPTPFWEPYLLYLVLLWAALRFGQQGATATVFLAAVLATWGTATGHGPALHATLHESLTTLQRFMVVFAVTALFLGAVIVELKRVSAERAGLLAAEREARARISAAEARGALLAILLDQSDDAVVVWELEGGIVYWNQGAERLYGFSADDARGKVIHDLLRTEPASGLCASSVDAALSGEGRWDGELFHTTRDGRLLRVESRNVLGRFGEGPALVLETNRDVTARKEAEVEREQLLESERTARGLAEREARSKDEFVATLSHELRTPLNAILGWTSMLRAGRLDAETSARALETIDRNARAQARMVDDLLDVSRIVAGKLRLDVRRIDLGDVVEAAIASLQPAAAAKRTQVERIVDQAACAVDGDAARLEQVIWNLVGNAIKFTQKGGHVRVVVRCAGSYAEIVVSDNGPGIPTEFLPHLFERFRQADASRTRRHGGLGLGLALVKHLVEVHGGTVGAESPVEGRGATFVVRLPISPVVPRGAELCAPLVRESLKGVKVLVVDDEEDTRELVRRVLSESEADVMTVGSAAEALDEVPRFRPDVLLSDIGMPQQDGYQLLRALRALGEERGGKTPAAALTAYARAEDRLHALRAGFQIHVTKPVDATELVTVVASLAGRIAS